jgi:aspartate-semialdehyde dehydrogenase
MNVGIIGWRGMVGSVLVRRMLEEGDFGVIDPRFFSTSQAGGQSPAIGSLHVHHDSFAIAIPQTRTLLQALGNPQTDSFVKSGQMRPPPSASFFKLELLDIRKAIAILL